MKIIFINIPDMIISHKYKFIYIKNRKVAGTSFEVFMKQFLDKDDIITTIEVRDDEDEEYNKTCNPCGFRQHIFASHLKEKAIKEQVLTEEQWDNYFKFSFIRTPWNYFKSYYCYAYKALEQKIITNKVMGNIRIPFFEKWVLSQNRCLMWEQISRKKHGPPHTKNYTEYEDIVTELYPTYRHIDPIISWTIDNVPSDINCYKYEQLYDNVRWICAKLDIPASEEYIKKTFPKKITDTRSWREIKHTQKTIDHIEDLCKNIIRIGEYKKPSIDL